MKDNTAIVLTVLLYVIKDVSVLALCSFLAWYFNNIWIILFAIIFMGGYSFSLKETKEKTEGDEENENK